MPFTTPRPRDDIKRHGHTGPNDGGELRLSALLGPAGDPLVPADLPHSLLNGDTHPDTVPQTPSRGSLIKGNATPLWDELTVGAAGTVLKADGTDAAWGALVAGDIPDISSTYLTVAAASAGYQPLDSDLTAIAALTTTAYGRGLLTLADAAALTAGVNAFTSALKGLAPGSGGGTTNFLRADGTWAAPPGTAATSLVSERASQVIAAGTTIATTDGTPVTPFTTASGSNITSTAIPLIAAGRDGQLLILRNDNGTDAAGLIIKDTNFLANSGMRLDADTLTLEGTSVAGFIYSATLGAWVFQWYKKLKHYTGAISSFTVDSAGSLTHEWGDGSTANDTAPTFALTYAGIPTAASVTLTASPDAGYPLTLTTPFLSGSGAAYFRSATRNGTRTFRASATVNGSAVTSDVVVTYRAPNYSGVIAQNTNITSAQAVALTHTLDTDPYGTYSSIPATGVNDRIWFGFVTGDAVLDSTLFFSIAGARAKFDLKNNPLSVTSTYGKVQNYDTYCSSVAQLGTVSVTVQSSRPPTFRYVGKVNQATQLSEAQIEGLQLSDLTESPNGTFASITGLGASDYLWFCVPDTNVAAPAHYGMSPGNGSTGYEEAAFTAMTVTSVTNLYGYQENYKNIHSNVTGLNSLTINAATTTTWSMKTQAAAFNYRSYIGPHADAAITSAHILTLDDASSGSSFLASALAGTYTVTVGAGVYLWVCHDSTVADISTIKDVSTGFAVAGSYRTDVSSHTTQFGVTGRTMRVWRSDNQNIYPSGGSVVIT